MTEPRLLMIVPTRGRVGNAAELAEAWRATVGDEARLLFAVDDDDPHLDAYQKLGHTWHIPVRVGPRRRIGAILNDLSAWAVGVGFDAVGFMGDDHRPRTVGWARRFLDKLDDLGTGMVYGDDLIQGPNLPTAIAMTSDIVTALGYMVPGGLEHLCIDNAWLELGRAIGRIAYLGDVIIEHMHPIAGKAEWDAGYQANNDPAQYDADGHRFADWRHVGLDADAARLRHMIAMKAARR